MPVPKSERKTSKEEFDAIHYRIYDDSIEMVAHNFRAEKDIAERNKDCIAATARELRNLVYELVYHIKVANALYPTIPEELKERRIHQDKAIGICFDILVLYELVMHKLRVKDDLGVTEIKHIRHQINALRAWRTSDNKRFRDLKQ